MSVALFEILLPLLVLLVIGVALGVVIVKLSKRS